MTNILLIIILMSIFFILLFPLFFKFKRNKRLSKKTIIAPSYKPLLEEKSNPDISTENWDLHKIRLEKFRRSQYKGLTFFLSSENRIYYITEEGDEVYC